MTFQVVAAEHDFKISFSSRKAPSSSVHLIVEPGKHYCVRLSAKNLTPLIVPIQMLYGKIEEIPCTQAIQEASAYKRVDLKRVDPGVRPELDTSSSFPREN